MSDLEIKEDADSSMNAESLQDDIWKDDPTAMSPQGVMSDEKGDLEVRVCIVLPGLKKKFGKNEPSNAEKLVVKTKEQSLAFSLLMSVPGKKEKQKYHYHVNRLPDKILAEKTKFKVKDDQVVITLHKEVARSWVPELSTGGLETQEEEDPSND
ncbi:hypothetical protein NP493_14g03028 [Ridgeia piscesae]|uniref:CS domain-containing protein n=1 Tax=Ridgeia piscesae TaxID=27915 RepID=A0AAD9PEN4_RIDPI|nr:hypothetical protein NP493_14g03028 [Ridgeia piscesae]